MQARRLILSVCALVASVAVTLSLTAAGHDTESDLVMTLPTKSPMPLPLLDAAQAFSLIAERPLFSPSRRSNPKKIEDLVVPQPVALASVTPPAAALVGVMLTPIAETAILRLANGSSVRLVRGEKIENWTLETVKSDHITLTSGSGSYDLAFPTSKSSRSQETNESFDLKPVRRRR